jgi:hypothetical protein
MPGAQPRARCQFQKANGEYCKKQVARGETHCHWHASGFKSKIKSLERSHRLGFWLGVAAFLATLGFGGLEVWQYLYRTTPNTVIGNSSGDNSPNILDNHGSVTIQNHPDDTNHNDKSKKKPGETK